MVSMAQQVLASQADIGLAISFAAQGRRAQFLDRDREQQRSKTRWAQDARYRETNKQWKAAHPEITKAIREKSRQADLQHDLLTKRSYYAGNRFERCFYHLRKRNIAKGLGEPDFGPEFLRQLFDDQEEACACCGCQLEQVCPPAEGRKVGSQGSWSIDRVDSKKGYSRDNVALLCLRCNLVKRDGTAEEHALIASWMLFRGVQ